MLAANPTSISKSIPVSELCVSVFSSPNPSPFSSNPSTRNLASFVDALDAASSISPVFATLTKNTGGWGTPSFSANSVPSALKSTHALPSTDPFDALHCPLAAIPFTIRTYEKCTRNPCRMNTSKTQDLKLFRINTYEKTGGGERSPHCASAKGADATVGMTEQGNTGSSGIVELPSAFGDSAHEHSGLFD
jgi:hypothetical protein